MDLNYQGVAVGEPPVTSNVNETPKSFEDEPLQAALNEHLRDAVRPATLGAAGLFVLFSISHLFLLPPRAVPVMVSLATCSVVAYLFMYFIATRRPLPLRWVHPVACAGLSVPVVNTLVHMYLLQDAYQSTNIALVIVGAGIYLLVSGWWIAMVATALLSWLLVVVMLSPSVPSHQWIHFGYMLIVATVLSAISHIGRLRAIKRIERLHLADARRQQDLEQALQAVQQSEVRLQQAHAELEQRVSAQTIELERANVELSREVAERRRTEADTQFLAEASARVAGSLDYTATLESVVQHAVPYLADYCIIDLLENDQLQQAAVAHVVPEKLYMVRELRRAVPFNPQLPFGVAKVLREGLPELVPHVEAHEVIDFMKLSPEHAHLLQELRPHAYMIVPLVAGTTTIGVMSLVSSESQRVFEQRHLQLATDLAHRAALAVEHARLYQKANQAILVRDAFVSIAAHELKSPLTALKGYAQLLYERAQANAAADAFQQRALQTVLTQSKRLEQLIVTMLDVSLIDNDQLALNLQRVSIPDLLQRVVEDLRMIFAMHAIEIRLNADQPPHVWGDASRLEQVFQNLLQNAVKYSPNGGQITVTVDTNDQQVIVSVADTGIGIAAADIPQLFQRFYRASSAEHSNIKGMGIGLFVVREIVERHGGSIEVESVEWEGSTFRVRLPLHHTEGGGDV